MQHRLCETCTYFDNQGNRNDSGQCRRHAPKHGTSQSQWPIVSKYSWCGEYAPAISDTYVPPDDVAIAF